MKAMTQRSSPSTSDKRFCTDATHLSKADCVAAMHNHSKPVNGDQSCLLVGIRNAYLMFRSLMQVDNKELGDVVPPEARTAGLIWERFQSAVNGCIDAICEDGGNQLAVNVLEVYADFGTPQERANALAVLLDSCVHHQSPLVHEQRRRLRVLLPTTPVIAFIHKHLQAKPK